MDLGLTSASQSSAETPVYLGVWTNWSRGRVFGPTLTLTRQDGDLLIAFVAFFVSFVGTRFWRICCLIFHLVYSSNSPQDGLYHQRQAILRNASNAESGLVSFLQMVWAWKKSSRRALLRMLAPIAITAFCVFGFIIASGFSSRVSTGAGDEVLISSEYCGWLNSSIDMSPDPIQNVFLPYSASLFGTNSNYARECYTLNASGTLNCGTFVKKNLLDKVHIDANYHCPFPGGLCRKNDSNLMMDSGYLDSNDDFGLNAPPDQRFQFRNVLQCAPLKTEGFTSTYNLSSDRSYTRYHYGDFHSGDFTKNYTYEYTNDRVYEADSVTANGTSAIDDYSLGAAFVQPWNGDWNYSANFKPMPELLRLDADLSIIFLSANGITFANKTEDDWYKATTPWRTYMDIYGDNPTRLPAYAQDEPASPLACMEQYQLCNPNLPEGSRCTPLSSSTDVGDLGVSLFEDSEASQTRYLWSMCSLISVSGGAANLVMNVGSQALTARTKLRSGYQTRIPDNQWQRDVAYWYSSSLAGHQLAFVTAAAGPPDANLRVWSQKPRNPVEESLCKNQKMRSTKYSSFSIFGLGIIFGLGGFITVLSYSTSPLLSFLQKRRKFRAYANVEWCVNETLQLQRLAHEGAGCGTWSKAADWVPTTRPDEELGLLDISDPDHPKLKPSSVASPTVTKVSEKLSEKFLDEKFSEKRTDSDLSERSEVEIRRHSIAKC